MQRYTYISHFAITHEIKIDSIIIKNLTKKYGDLKAVNNLSLNIKDNEIFGLLGPNGAGKTTLINVLSTLLKPSNGEAFINKFSVKKSPSKVRQSIGVVFQETILDNELNAMDNLDFHGRLYNIPKQLREKKIRDLLSLVGLWDCRKKRVDTYSGGMKRRLEIARGLLHHPKVLFLDEPTLGLDPQTRRHIWDYISDLNKKEKVTILLTTHYMEEADYLCDRVAFIDKGKIIALGEPKNLKSKLGRDIIKVRLKKLDNRIIDSLKKATPFKNIKISRDIINFHTRNAETKIVKFLDIVKKSGGQIIEVSIHKPTLEDVFIYHTGRKIKNDI